MRGAHPQAFLPAIEAEERAEERPFPVYRLRHWESSFSGLVAGVTAAGPEADFSASRGPAWSFVERVDHLANQLGLPAAAWGRQVHGAEVTQVDDAPPRGICSPGQSDGLLCCRDGLLLIVTVADCVPVYLLDPSRQVLSLLHAGWRGAAAGILNSGVSAARAAYGSQPSDLYLHLGPSICEGCYEVGPEVLRAFGRAFGPVRPAHR